MPIPAQLGKHPEQGDEVPELTVLPNPTTDPTTTAADDKEPATTMKEGDDASGDPVLTALEELATALERVGDHQQLLATRVSSAIEARRQGKSWRDVLERDDEPKLVQLLSQVLAELSGASGKLRRSLVHTLRDEGESIPWIAHVFGVTHQRVSNLLRQRNP